MATTYGYGGEFSSDEDVDKLEQIQTDRIVQAKFDSSLRPSKKHIEETIELIKLMPVDEEVNLSDEMLASLLDYYKTQRGPIVDSTRKLYNKIALRLIRGDQQQSRIDNTTTKDTNGSSNSNVDNNNSIHLIQKTSQKGADTFSSDEDDDLPTNRRNVEINDAEDEIKMDVDLDTPTGPVRVTKQVDMSTTDEDDDEDDKDTIDEDTSELEELNSESDVMDVTPIKSPANHQRSKKEKDGVEAVIAASRINQRQPLAQSTPKDSTDTAKKPYTRSQRIATRSATRNKVSIQTDTKHSLEASNKADFFIENKQSFNRKYGS